MRLFELAYCCRLYAEGTGYDVALARFLEGTNAAADLCNSEHRDLTLQWLRDWGCRGLRREDNAGSSAALREWWEDWADVLPATDVTLDALDDYGLDVAAEAYGDLARRPAAQRQHRDGFTIVRFGPTTAAKAMYAVRPHAFLPWDDAIRKKLGFREDAAAYRQALVRARDELTEAVGQAGIDPHELPELIGRPQSTPPKLVDEHDWVRYTLGHEPPTREELRQWREWL
jgi:hypothetical protein